MGLFGVFKPTQRRAPKKGPREDLPPEVRSVVGVLREVEDPETGLNIVDEGLLYGLTVEGEKIQVFLLMARSTPECHACRMLAINVQRRILIDIVDILREEGFKRIEVYNELGLLLEEWGDEDGSTGTGRGDSPQES
ncbi:iron-sulfur cluster assembly protein [Thermococcus sp.]|uniref:iron-sulfur cluster assembly protein n=1 Tax=Thermococcus sp. TaxID=35749 RepID=UPI0026025E6E|nr:iron-sulfur cluster assembly protein [Thermococcus sp.]